MTRQVKYCCGCWVEDGVRTISWLTNVFTHSGSGWAVTGNDHTDRQTGGRAGGRAARLSDICKDIFNLAIFLSCEISRKKNNIHHREIGSFRTSPASLKYTICMAYRSYPRVLRCEWIKHIIYKHKRQHLCIQSGRTSTPRSPLWSINTARILPSQVIEAQWDLQELNCQRRVPRLKPAVLSVPTHVRLKGRPVHRRSGVWV